MKKILVVLLIVAVAGGVFAQDGEWSVNAYVEFGARIDVNPTRIHDWINDPMFGTEGVYPEGADDVAMNRRAYFRYDKPFGMMQLRYNLESFTAGVDLTTTLDGTFGFMEYQGENYKFHASVKNLLWMLDNSQTTPAANAYAAMDRLWGEYNFLDGLVNLEVALDSRDNGDSDWTSDKSGVFKGGDNGNIGLFMDTEWYRLPNSWEVCSLFGTGNTFAAYDHPSLIAARINLENFNFGIQVRNVFAGLFEHQGDGYLDFPDAPALTGPAWDPYEYSRNKFVEDVIKSSVVGMKFNLHPLEIAAQFQFRDYGVYFGGKFFAGPITVGLSFNGLLQDSQRMKFGGNVEYNGGAFGIGVMAFYDTQNISGGELTGYGIDWDSTLIGIEPSFWYNVLPNNMAFDLKTGFYFQKVKDNAASTDEFLIDDVVWALQPSIWWNFKGTGASNNYYGIAPWNGQATGMIFTYRIVSDRANFFDMIFRWNF